MTAQIAISLGLLAAMFVLFLMQRHPLGLIAMGCGIAMAICGIIKPQVVVSSFGSGTIALLAGTTIISSALFKTGFADVLGAKILNMSWVTKSEARFAVVLILLVCAVSAFMSNTATCAMFFPLIAAVAAKSNGRITKKGTYMMVALASIAGGSITLPGSTPQMSAQGYLEITEGARLLTFFELSWVGIPLIALMIGYYLLFGLKLQRKFFDFEEVPDDPDELDKVKVVKIDRTKMWISGFTLFGCIVAFVAGWLNIGVVALTGAVVVIACGCISEKDAFKAVPWDILCLVAGSAAFGQGLQDSGAVEYLVRNIIAMIGGENASPFIAFAVVLIVGTVLTQVVTNVAVTACICPIAIGLAKAMNVDMMPFVVASIYSAQWAFFTPVGAAPMAMSMTGGYRFRDYYRVTGPYGIICVVAGLVLIPLFHPF